MAPFPSTPPARAPWAALALGIVLGCGAAPDAPPESLAAGTFLATPREAWPEGELRFGHTRRGLAARVGEVTILEGDDEVVSGIEGALGLRFDEERNDLARVAARVAAAVGDDPAVLALFTTFDDRGAAGRAYFVPFFNDTAGTGMERFDARPSFGVRHLEGLANLKRPSGFGEATLADLAHELAHRHLARLEARLPGGEAVPLLGRQNAHWHALLHTRGSLLGGHDFVERAPGRFVVARREEAFSELDLYGLGLLAASEVRPFFFVRDGRSAAGAEIPAGAELPVGVEITGERQPLEVADVLAAMGPRAPAFPEAPLELRVIYVLLTSPGEAANDPPVLELAAEVEALRAAMDGRWMELTGGRGRLCSIARGCTPEAPIEAPIEEPPMASPGCSCAALDAQRGGDRAPWLALLLGALAWGVRRTAPAPGRRAGPRPPER